MKEEVLARDFDLGFSGNSEDVVMHAIQLLGNCVTITHTSRNDEFFITPSTTVPSVFELNFYSNGVLHVFIMEAIIGMSGLQQSQLFSWEVERPKTQWCVLWGMAPCLGDCVAAVLVSNESVICCHVTVYDNDSGDQSP